MLEEAVTSAPSLWAAMNSWFTPSVLFVLLNIMIGTIAITSSFANQKHRQHNPDDPNHYPPQVGLARSPSVLQRLRSISFHGYGSHELHHQSQPIAAHFSPIEDSHTHYYSQQTYQTHTPEIMSHHIFRTPSVLQRLSSTNFFGFRSQELHQSPPVATHFSPVEDSHNHYYSPQTHQAHNPETVTHHISRTPSVLQRLSSINFFSFGSQEPHQSPPVATHFGPIEDSAARYYSQQTHQAQITAKENEHIYRTPSVLQRLSSINFFGFRSQEPRHCRPIENSDSHFYPQQNNKSQTAETEIRQTRFDEQDNEPRSLDEVYSQLQGRHVNRTKSDTEPASGQVPDRLPARMRKSASVKSAFAHFEEEDVVEARRPANINEHKTAAVAAEEDDHEVDAKADDFINRFKQQLKLQRLDSILRYKEMITGGSGK
ncbi:hypothetical protein NMG60_11000764 [Bertholletia excelsa]